VSGGVYINGVRVVNRGDKRMRLATLARASAC